MLRSDALLRYSFFYRGDNDYRNSSVSFCNAEPLLISDFFSAPLAKQKETRYNMTKRTELVIFKEAWAWLLPTMKQNNFTRRCSFYKFYESKEMAFFAVLESIHSELYGVADHALSEANGLPSSERAAEAVLAVCRRLSDTGDMVFIENDAKLLLQRLPEDVKNIHYHDDETHIRQLLEKYGLVPKRGISLAAATVRGLILTVSHKEQIGELYPQVLETLVYGACRELFK